MRVPVSTCAHAYRVPYVTTSACSFGPVCGSARVWARGAHVCACLGAEDPGGCVPCSSHTTVLGVSWQEGETG